MNADGRSPGNGSSADRLAYWAERGRRIDWIDPYGRVATEDFDASQPVIRWFEGGTLNVASNCLDRFAALEPNAPALMWAAADPSAARTWTRRELLSDVARFANVLKAYGVMRGDRVLIYLPTCPEAVIAMLAAARIGAIHAVIFTGYSGRALAGRMRDCGARLVVTADAIDSPEGLNLLKEKVDVAADLARTVEKVLVVRKSGRPVEMRSGRDVYLDTVIDAVSDRCPPVEVDAEHPLFLAYTMGVSGRPKGIVHASGGWLVHVTQTLEDVLGATAGDVVWCTADIGNIAAHAYGVYGPLANGAATVLFEPGGQDQPARRLAALRAHKVSVLYTSPAIARDQVAASERVDLATLAGPEDLKVIGTFGEAVTQEVWHLLHDGVGRGRTPVVETWWQTESGGILLAGEASHADVPGGRSELHATLMRPVPGVPIGLVDGTGRLLEGAAEGEVVLSASWPGQVRTIHDDHLRFAHSYFGRYRGLFRTGDSAVRDGDGAFQVIGRVDDILHVGGHRLPAEEVEKALSDHRFVAEAAVVELPRAARTRGLCAFLVLAPGARDRDDVEAELVELVRIRIGEFATPSAFRVVRALPKSRSGKIVRRILRQIVAGTFDDMGDRTSLSDPSLIDELLADRSLLLPG